MKARKLNQAIPTPDDLGHLEDSLATAFEGVLQTAGRDAAAAFERQTTHHELVAAAPSPRSAMIAVYPSDEQAATLSQVGGEDADTLHVTLAFLGEIDPDQAAGVVAALSTVAPAHDPLEGEVGGVACFGDNGDGYPSILLPDVHGLAELRHAVCEALDAAGIWFSGTTRQIESNRASADPGGASGAALGGRGSVAERLPDLFGDAVEAVRGSEGRGTADRGAPNRLDSSQGGDPTGDGRASRVPDEAMPERRAHDDEDQAGARRGTRADPGDLLDPRNALRDERSAGMGTMPSLREGSESALQAAATGDVHGWVPHVTLSYQAEPTTPPASLMRYPLNFDTVSVSVGDVRRDLALGGGLAAGAKVDPEPAPEDALAAAAPPPWTHPHPDEIVNVEELIARFRGKADPIRLEVVRQTVTPALDAAAGSTRSEVEQWASDSTLKHPVYHYARAEDAKAILRSGFIDQSDALSQYGKGVYLALDEKTADLYRKEGSAASVERVKIEARIKVTNPFTINLPRTLLVDGERVALEDAGLAAFRDHLIDVIGRDEIEARRAAGVKREQAFTDVLRGRGYDALIVKQPDVKGPTDPFTRRVGGNQVIVFDASNVRPIADEALKAAAGLAFDVTNPMIAGVAGRIGQHITFIAETTRLNAMRIVRRSYEEGLSIPDTATAIRAGMASASVARSRLIARTEMTSLVNGGSLAATRIIDDALSAARDAGEPDAQDFVGYQKTWMTAEGAHFPRHETYEGLDGQTVALEQPFDVGGMQLMYPGDPDGPPEEVCNCRCSVSYVDAAGNEGDGEGTDMTAAANPPLPFTTESEGGDGMDDETAMTGECSNCGHDAGAHAGAQNDGACPMTGCDCEGFVAAEAGEAAIAPAGEAALEPAPGGTAAMGGMTAFVRIRPELPPEFHAEIANATSMAMRSGIANLFSPSVTEPVTFTTGKATTNEAAVPAPADVRPERTDGITPPETVARTNAQQQWNAMLAPEGKATDDGRIFAPGSIRWRELPLTLMAMLETPGEGGHAGAFVAGRIDRIWRDDSTQLPHWINGEGTFDDGDQGDEIARLVADQTLRGNSVDLAISRVEFGLRALFVDDHGVWRDDAPAEGEAPEPTIDDLMGNPGDILMIIREATIGMSTVCPFPAFADANIVLASGEAGDVPFALEQSGAGIIWKLWTKDTLTSGDVVTASAAGFAPARPPAAWFDNPELGELTALTVDEDGRVTGHAWSWGECHIGIPGACVTAPHSNTDYAYFHLKEVECEDGQRVAVGTITLGTGHADQRASRQAATEHYDHTGAAVADVRVYEDAHGGAVAGALRPEVAAGRVREFRGSTPSGDWRKVNGNLELVGLLAVNVPGFPVPRTKALVASVDEGQADVLTLTAAGIPERPAGLGQVEFEPADRARLAALAARAEGGLQALARLAASRPTRNGPTLTAAAPVWDGEAGLMDVMRDISAALNPGDSWRWFVLDIAIGGGSAIVGDMDTNEYWLVPLTYDAGEPILPAQSEWTAVESTWVAEASAAGHDAYAKRRLTALAARVA